MPCSFGPHTDHPVGSPCAATPSGFCDIVTAGLAVDGGGGCGSGAPPRMVGRLHEALMRTQHAGTAGGFDPAESTAAVHATMRRARMVASRPFVALALAEEEAEGRHAAIAVLAMYKVSGGHAVHTLCPAGVAVMYELDEHLHAEMVVVPVWAYPGVVEPDGHSVQSAATFCEG